MQYLHALRLASTLVKQMGPYCERIEIAGSIRRQRQEVKDIETVSACQHGGFQVRRQFPLQALSYEVGGDRDRDAVIERLQAAMPEGWDFVIYNQREIVISPSCNMEWLDRKMVTIMGPARDDVAIEALMRLGECVRYTEVDHGVAI